MAKSEENFLGWDFCFMKEFSSFAYCFSDSLCFATDKNEWIQNPRQAVKKFSLKLTNNKRTRTLRSEKTSHYTQIPLISTEFKG